MQRKFCVNSPCKGDERLLFLLFLNRDATGIARQLAELYLTDSLLVNCTPLVFSLESSMGSLNAILEVTTLKKLTEVLGSLAVNDPTPQIRLSASRLVAALLNKSSEGW